MLKPEHPCPGHSQSPVHAGAPQSRSLEIPASHIESPRLFLESTANLNFNNAKNHQSTDSIVKAVHDQNSSREFVGPDLTQPAPSQTISTIRSPIQKTDLKPFQFRCKSAEITNRYSNPESKTRRQIKYQTKRRRKHGKRCPWQRRPYASTSWEY